MKTAISLLTAAMLVGCASSQRMTIAELDSFRIDCSKYEQQREFLVSQYPSRSDRQAALFSTMSLLGVFSAKDEGTYDQHNAIRRGEMQASVKYKIQQLDTTCGKR